MKWNTIWLSKRKVILPFSANKSTTTRQQRKAVLPDSTYMWGLKEPN